MIDLDVTLERPAFRLRVRARLRGPVTAVFGPSGAGKTTLLRVLAGLERPAGTLRVNGQTWVSDRTYLPPRRRRVGYVPQAGLLFPHMTVRRNVEFAARGPVDDVLEWLQIAGIADQLPSKISGGQARRVALARALVTEPQLMLLDEPVAGLDLPMRDRALDLIDRVRKRFSIPIVYVTHAAEEVLRIADEVLLLRDGKVLGIGAPEQVLGNAGPLTYENHLRLPVRGDRAGIGTQEIVLPEPVRGERVDLRIGGAEILLAAEPPPKLSACTILKGVVRKITRLGTRVFVTVDAGEPLVSVITPDVERELELREGKPVFLILKTSSIRVIR